MAGATVLFGAVRPLFGQARDGALAYPARPVRLIVPFAAGAAPDVRARQLADKLAQQLGQPVIVENRPGAGGQIGMQQAAAAAPDGYTLVMAGQSALAIQPHLTKQPFDPLADFVPIAMTGEGVMALVVHPKLGVASLDDLVRLVQRRPGALNASSWGNATIPHLALELFKRSAAVDIVHVPYKETGQAVKDLLAGEVQLAFDFLPLLAPHIRSGRVQALAVTGPRRLAALPEVPTFTELGLRAMEDVRGWQGVAAPSGTPGPIIDQLNAAVVRALTLPEVEASYVEQGFEVSRRSAREFAQYVRAEHARWGALIATAGIRAD
jgi:tripartite-type tricarboxylate transporter receptor subunit TctC